MKFKTYPLQMAKNLLEKAFSLNSPPVAISVEDDTQDQIERLYLKLTDADEANNVLKDINANLTLRNAELQAKVEQEQQYRLKQSDNAYELNKALHKIQQLEKDLLLEVGNRNHFRSLVAQQDAFITEAKRQVQAMKTTYEETLQARKNEVDHLAKQAIRLNEELAKVKTDNCQFTEQTTRLVEEKRKLTEKLVALDCQETTPSYGSLCGGCITCQMKQIDHASKGFREDLAKLGLELSFERDISNKRLEQVGVLADAIRLFKKMPCITWRQQGKLVRGTQAKVDVLQAEINGLRNNFYKVKPQEPKASSKPQAFSISIAKA